MSLTERIQQTFGFTPPAGGDNTIRSTVFSTPQPVVGNNSIRATVFSDMHPVPQTNNQGTHVDGNGGSYTTIASNINNWDIMQPRSSYIPSGFNPFQTGIALNSHNTQGNYFVAPNGQKIYWA
jgi:hypothetical protein